MTKELIDSQIKELETHIKMLSTLNQNNGHVIIEISHTKNRLHLLKTDPEVYFDESVIFKRIASL